MLVLRIVVAGLLSASALAPATADPLIHDRSRLVSPDRPPLPAAYAVAMWRYRAATAGSAQGYPLVGGSASRDPWTWTSVDGSVLYRLAPGSFRVTLSTAAGSLYIDIDCHDAGWPLFMCSDGRERQMKAPDFSTVIFDNIEFRRRSPE